MDIYVAVRFHEKYQNVDKFERKMIDHGFKMENNNLVFIYNHLTFIEFISPQRFIPYLNIGIFS